VDSRIGSRMGLLLWIVGDAAILFALIAVGIAIGGRGEIMPSLFNVLVGLVAGLGGLMLLALARLIALAEQVAGNTRSFIDLVTAETEEEEEEAEPEETPTGRPPAPAPAAERRRRDQEPSVERSSAPVSLAERQPAPPGPRIGVAPPIVRPAPRPEAREPAVAAVASAVRPELREPAAAAPASAVRLEPREAAPTAAPRPEAREAAPAAAPRPEAREPAAAASVSAPEPSERREAAAPEPAPSSEVVDEFIHRGRRVRSLEDGSLEAQTSTGWKRFRNLIEFDASIG